MDFKTELNKRVDYIENIIYSSLIDSSKSNSDKQAEIYEAMNYSVQSGGKRLRPMLMLETSRLFHGRDEDVSYFLTVIELIHTYSLVHDDLEAMDNDEYRRGRKTTHAVYGEAMGVLCGDALLNYAFEMGLKGIKAAKDKDRALDALDYIATKAGAFGMIGGQVVDIKNENSDIDIETLDYINELKTGALIEASMVAGAILAGATKQEVQSIEKIASNVGKAFQIQDDILDVTSTTEVLGKPVLSDEKNNKSTYVTLLGIEAASEKVKQLSEEAILILRELNEDNVFLTELIHHLVYRKK